MTNEELHLEISKLLMRMHTLEVKQAKHIKAVTGGFEFGFGSGPISETSKRFWKTYNYHLAENDPDI